MRVESFAKINLGLEVIRERPDGFHEIRTLFQSVGLRDILEFRLRPSGRGIELSGSDPRISWAEDNLIHRAATLLSREAGTDKGADIHATKNIPPGRGLGGGSSNAAMTLWALNRLWDLGLSRQDLMDLGAELGSDVPYFLRGGLCLGSGRGDEIRTLKDIEPPLHVLLVFPHLPVSTGFIYGEHRVTLTSRDKDSKIVRFLKSPGLRGLENDLEETIFRYYPLIRESKQRLHDLGSELTLVSGSGSAVFGLFSDPRAARTARRTVHADTRACLVETWSRDRYWEAASAGV